MNNNMIRSSSDFTRLFVVPTYVYKSVQENVRQDTLDELASYNKKLQPDANIFTKAQLKAHEEKSTSKKKKKDTTENLSQTSSTMENESTLSDTPSTNKNDEESTQNVNDTTEFHTPEKPHTTSTPNAPKAKKQTSRRKNTSKAKKDNAAEGLGVKKSKLVSGVSSDPTESVAGSSNGKQLIVPPFPDLEDKKLPKTTSSGRIVRKPKVFGKGIKYHLV